MTDLADLRLPDELPGMTTAQICRVLQAVHATPLPLVDVRCPHCRNLLARVSKGAAVEVKCLRCKTWLVTDAA